MTEDTAMIQDYRNYVRLRDRIIPLLIKSDWMRQDFNARLSCAETQRGTHIDSLPTHAPPPSKLLLQKD